jgi:hypothetical protein
MVFLGVTFGVNRFEIFSALSIRKGVSNLIKWCLLVRWKNCTNLGSVIKDANESGLTS